MRILIWAVASLALVVAAIVAIGYILPVRHVASRDRDYAAPPDRVFAAIATPAGYPGWRPDVRTVEMLPDSDGHMRFREVGKDGAITFQVEEMRSPERLVTRIADQGLPFGGSWTFELSPQPAGTRLRITENGEVYNPIFRFVSRYVMGHDATIERYLADLDRHLGPATAAPAR